MTEKLSSFSTFFRLLRRIRVAAGKPRVCIISAWLTATFIALCITAIQGVPAPSIHDEFAYLLGADTFAAGRVTNSTHPMWQHFETFHVIQEPSYTCKYPPAQALTMALGQKLGHPIVGVCLATGISIGALVWMLTGWLPRKWHWMIWVFAVFHPGLHLFWGQSYWGGAVALTGASLLIGSFGRMTRKFEIHLSMLAGLGVLLLANSRPFEGVVLTVTIGLALVWRLIRNVDWNLSPFLIRVLGPGLSVLGLGVALMLSYNLSVTGHALKMPYRIHEASYGWTPLFLWETAGHKPEYRHPVMENFYVADKKSTEARFQSATDVVSRKSQSSFSILRFFCSELGLIALLGLPLLFCKSRYRMAGALLIPVAVAAMATPWSWPHYFAPALPLILLLFFGGFIEAWNYVFDKPALRFPAMAAAVVFYLVWAGGVVSFSQKLDRLDWGHKRVAVEAQLDEMAGDDLVIVRYSPKHNPNHEWVYNAADIDGAAIVWAREMPDAETSKLLEYFSDRNIWLVEADAETVVARRYTASPSNPMLLGRVNRSLPVD